MNEEVGFQVNDEIEVGDLSGVQESILPKASNVKAQIVKASVKTSKDENLKSLNLQLKFVEGIEVEGEAKYVGKTAFTGFMDVVVWAAQSKVDASDWYKSGQHLLGFKQFLIALGEDIKSPPKVNDEWLLGLAGREVLVNIVHEAETAVGPSGDREKTGTFVARFKNWKSAA